MKNLVKPLCSVAVALAMGFPLPATAEMLGADPCAILSWNALVLGECGIDTSPVLGQSHRGEADNSTVLVVSISDAVPEPETYALMLAGLVVVAVAARRRRRSKPL